MPEQTAAEQVAKEWADRAEQFGDLFGRMDGTGEDADNATEELQELPLGIAVRGLIRIDLSTGGPGDWLEVVCDGDDVLRITYHFSPWWDHAEMDVTDDPSAMRFVRYFLGE